MGAANLRPRSATVLKGRLLDVYRQEFAAGVGRLPRTLRRRVTLIDGTVVR